MIKAFEHQGEYRVEWDETSFRGDFVDYRTQEEGVKHFRQPDILVASRSGQKSEIKRQPDVAGNIMLRLISHEPPSQIRADYYPRAASRQRPNTQCVIL